MYDREMAALLVPFRVECRHEFNSGFVEVRRYYWASPLEQVFTALSDYLVINMALAMRPHHTQMNRVEGGQGSLPVDTGRILIMVPGMEYHLAAPSGNLRSVHCAIRCEKLEEIAGEAIEWGKLGNFGGDVKVRSAIEPYLLELHKELRQSALGSALMIQACVDSICIQLLRRFREGSPSRPDIHRGGLASWRMKRIYDRLHNDDEPAPRVSELAELCGLTQRQLGRAFKAETGVTIGSFVDDFTMERAHRLLTNSEATIAEIAKILGFSGPESFSQSFRRVTGATPSSLRKR